MGQTQFRSDDTVKWWLGFGDGSDGDYSSSGNATDAPIDSSCSGTSGATTLSATNASFAAGKPVLIHQTRGTGAGNWELNQIDSYVAGTITLKKALQNTYTDSGASQAQVIQLKQYSSFTQNSGHTLTAKAWNGNVGGIIAFLAKGTVTITGTITATAKGFLGSSNYTGTSDNGYSGEGTVGAEANTASPNGNASGGGHYGTSRGAGHANAGSASGSDTGTPGQAGNAVGNASLTSFNFGGAAGQSIGGSSSIGKGGNGGGGVLIICNDITVSGSITTGGENGGVNSYSFGAGGGAGGSILIKSKTATLGTNKLTASGGAGYATTYSGGNGSVGRIHIDYSGTYSGTTSPTIDFTLDATIVPLTTGGPLFFAQY